MIHNLGWRRYHNPRRKLAKQPTASEAPIRQIIEEAEIEYE